MIDSHRLIAEKIENTVQRAAQHGGGKMPDVKRLGDIDGGIVDTNRFSLSLLGGPVGVLFLENFVQNLTGERGFIDFEIEISVDGGNFRDHVVRGTGFLELLGDQSGAFAENFRKFETRNRVIAHLRIGRQRDELVNFRRRHALDFKFFRNVLLIVHGFHLQNDFLQEIY